MPLKLNTGLIRLTKEVHSNCVGKTEMKTSQMDRMVEAACIAALDGSEAVWSTFPEAWKESRRQEVRIILEAGDRKRREEEQEARRLLRDSYDRAYESYILKTLGLLARGTGLTIEDLNGTGENVNTVRVPLRLPVEVASVVSMRYLLSCTQIQELWESCLGSFGSQSYINPVRDDPATKEPSS